MDFMICKKCGNIITFAGKAKCKGLTCCSEAMTELTANTVDAAKEKHVPAPSVSGNIVTVAVGSVAHPMEEKHHIAFVALETCQGVQIKTLEVGKEPKAVFALAEGETAKAAYAYCNLHGLWKADI